MNTKANSMMVLRLPLAAAVMGCLLAGCSSSSTEDLLGVNILPLQGRVRSGNTVSPFGDAESVRITATGPGMTEDSILSEFVRHSAGLPDLTYGVSRQLRIEAGPGGDLATFTPTSRGWSIPFTVQDGDPRRVINVFVSPRNAFSTPMRIVGTDEVPTGVENSAPITGQRVGATVTVLDNGQILIAGGALVRSDATSWNSPSDYGQILAEAELFDPSTGRFTVVGNMTTPRAWHQAVKMPDGMVAMIGGFSVDAGTGDVVGGFANSVEVFNPGTGVFTRSAHRLPNDAGRAQFTALLTDADQGFILLAGGRSNLTGSPSPSEDWTFIMLDREGAVGWGPLAGPRWNHTLTHLPLADGSNGAIVLVGGENASGALASAERFTIPKVGLGTNPSLVADGTGTMAGGPHTMHAAVYVPEADAVYVIGGFSDAAHAAATNAIEVYTAGSRQWQGPLPLDLARGAPAAVLMDGSTILISGGVDGNGAVLNSVAMILNASTAPQAIGGQAPTMASARAGHAMVFDATHRAFLIGGISSALPFGMADGAEIYTPD